MSAVPIDFPVPDTALHEALLEAKKRLGRLYGSRLAHLVLFGSHARGESHPESDVDLLAVLDEPVNVYQELKRIVPLENALMERYGWFFQIIPMSITRYRQDDAPLLQHIRVEGRTF